MLSVGRCGVARLQMKSGHMDGMHCIIDGTSVLVKIKSVAFYNCQTVYIGRRGHNRSFLTLALDGGQRSTSHPDHLTPGEEPLYPLNKRLCGPLTQSGYLEKKKIAYPCWDSNSQTV